MTLPSPAWIAFALVGLMMALFVWGRIRYDIVAMLTLLAALATGIVPADRAFSGFSDDIVIIVAGALVMSEAITRSGVIENAVSAVSRHVSTTARQVAAFSVAVALMSTFMKNIGALSMLMPIASRMSRRHHTPLSAVLMPMSFASLLGGMVTLVGTSPNIIVSRIREDTVGRPFGMFDFSWVGVPLLVAGIVLLVATHRLLGTRRRSGGVSLEAAFEAHGYITEATVLEDSPLAGEPVARMLALAQGDVTIAQLVRGTHKRFTRLGGQLLRPGDRLVLEGDPGDLEQFAQRAGLRIGDEELDATPKDPGDEIAVIEAVVTSNSMMIDWTPAQLRLFHRFGVTLIAVSRAGENVAQRLKSFRFQSGDLVVLRGSRRAMPDILSRIGCLPLAGRHIRIGMGPTSWLPLAVIALAMLAMALKLVSVPVAFFGAAAIVMALGAISSRDAYAAIDWPVIVTLAALIPVSDSMRTTGATDMIAHSLATLGRSLPAWGALAMAMTFAMAVTPFLNNAATVLVMGPIAARLAGDLGYAPDPFLMAVAIGAASDFLTPVGHQCNMLVWGPGGYRFSDYPRLGLPLSVMVVALGTPLILTFWPLQPH